MDWLRTPSLDTAPIFTPACHHLFGHIFLPPDGIESNKISPVEKAAGPVKAAAISKSAAARRATEKARMTLVRGPNENVGPVAFVEFVLGLRISCIVGVVREIQSADTKHGDFVLSCFEPA